MILSKDADYKSKEKPRTETIQKAERAEDNHKRRIPGAQEVETQKVCTRKTYEEREWCRIRGHPPPCRFNAIAQPENQAIRVIGRGLRDAGEGALVPEAVASTYQLPHDHHGVPRQ